MIDTFSDLLPATGAFLESSEIDMSAWYMSVI